MIIENPVSFDQNIVSTTIKEDAVITTAGYFQISDLDKATARELEGDVGPVAINGGRVVDQDFSGRKRDRVGARR